MTAACSGSTDRISASDEVSSAGHQRTVLLDANILMAPIETDLRVFDELERLVPGAHYTVPAAVVDELDRLADPERAGTGGGTERRAAVVARDLVRDRCRVVDHDPRPADDALLALSRHADYVATSDGPLRNRLLDEGVPVVSLRGTHKLAITTP